MTFRWARTFTDPYRRMWRRFVVWRINRRNEKRMQKYFDGFCKGLHMLREGEVTPLELECHVEHGLYSPDGLFGYTSGDHDRGMLDAIDWAVEFYMVKDNRF